MFMLMYDGFVSIAVFPKVYMGAVVHEGLGYVVSWIYVMFMFNVYDLFILGPCSRTCIAQTLEFSTI